DVQVTKEGHWNYLGHRFNVAGSQTQFSNGSAYQWGGDYQSSGAVEAMRWEPSGSSRDGWTSG
ncbi:MAG: hypothetical protein HY329_02320, partial [Chloroflexi bacterium]|nr:hypothetical protein [Chloroflexota bacterium]